MGRNKSNKVGYDLTKTSMKLKYKERDKLLSPMLCSTKRDKEAILKDKSYYFERKYDGIRAIYKDGELYNRKLKVISYLFPEIITAFEGKSGYFDGEIIAISNKFEDVQKRIHIQNKFKIEVLSNLMPCEFVMFHKFRGYYPNNRYCEKAYRFKDGLRAWNRAIKEDWEGLIAKKKIYKYKSGRSKDWIKLKVVKEAEIVVNAYELNPTGITITNPLRVAINGLQHIKVKEAIDFNGEATIRINYLERTTKGSYRQPTFKEMVR